MATGTRICKICGVEYPYCKTEYKEGVFRYQDVACCKEHGSEYLAKVIASREEPKVEAPTVTKKATSTKPATKKSTKQAVVKTTAKNAK